MATVYVVNRGGHNYQPAEKFGHLVFLSEGPMSKYATSQIYRRFSLSLRESSPSDYIMITGLTTMACIACACFAFMHGRINLLLFKNDRYIERSISLGELLSSTKGSEREKEIKEVIS